MKSEKKIKNYLLVYASLLFFITGGFFSVAHFASAATLNISPASGTYAVGQNFSISVTTTSTSQALNAIDGIVSFPTDKLEATSVSKDGSIINLWVEEPAISNSTGKVSLSGVVLNPGFSGTAGKVLKINFRVKKVGTAEVVFSSASILANDGLGTNILDNLNTAQFTLLNQVVKEAVAPTTPSKAPKVVPKAEIPKPAEKVVPEEKISSAGFFSPEFIKGVKIFLQNLFFLILILLLLSLIWFIVVRVSSAITLLKLKLQNEVKTINLSMYETWRKKIDDDFSKGEYLNALIGYKKLQEQAPAIKQGELNEKIMLANKFYVAKENFRKAQILAGRNKWIEAGALIEETEILTDPNFRYYDDTRKFYYDVEARLAEIKEKSNAQIITIKNRLAETLHQVEETKSKLVYQEGLLSGERAKFRQLEEENKKQVLLSEEKDKKNTILWSEREASFEKELMEAKDQISATRRRLTDTEHLAEEIKSQLTYQGNLLSTEKSKYEEAEEKIRNITVSSSDREMTLKKELENIKISTEQELENKKEKIVSLEKKLIDAERASEEIKSKLVYQEGLLLSEKTKRAEAEEEIRNLTILSKEQEKILKEELERTRDSLSKGFKESQMAREQEFGEKESTFKKQLEEAEEQIADSKKKLTNALHQIEEAEAQLAHQENLSNNEKDKLKVSEEENKKYFVELREKSIALQKALDEIMITKEKELSFKTAIATAEEQIIADKNEFSEALQREEEIKKQLTNTESLLFTEKSKRAQSERENDRLLALIKEKDFKLEKGHLEMETKFKEKESILTKKLEETKTQAELAKNKLAETERLFEEAKTQLAKEKELLSTEKTRSENLAAAISKLITPQP